MRNLTVEQMNDLDWNRIESVKIKNRHRLNFVTIWMSENGRKNKKFGFNFDPKPIGYTETEYGIKRTVVEIL